MPTDLPIACTLSAGDLAARLDEMAALGRDALLETEIDSNRATLRFAAGARVRERVAAIAAAEGQCCAFLTIAVSAGPGTITLSIDAPDGAEPVLREMVDAFRGTRPAAPTG
jgi:MerR family transcriptional regulator, copper efflux regulator